MRLVAVAISSRSDDVLSSLAGSRGLLGALCFAAPILDLNQFVFHTNDTGLVATVGLTPPQRLWRQLAVTVVVIQLKHILVVASTCGSCSSTRLT